MFFKITLENIFQSNFRFCVPKYLKFWKTFFENVNILENRIRKILGYEWEKINIKSTFKSILKNRIRKNMNFGNVFQKL
ncbi:hypothetical protein QL285_045907 [Trifolium repens]|nr:hypothetical protein QL285_045907 [Trifolium repens]